MATFETLASRITFSRVLIALLCVLPVAAVILFEAFLPPCWFHELTGLYCPGCGSGRALTALTRGDVLAALRFNPLLMTLLPLLGYEALRRGLAREQRWKNLLVSPTVSWAIAAAVLAFGVLRNLPFGPFAWLAPPTM